MVVGSNHTGQRSRRATKTIGLFLALLVCGLLIIPVHGAFAAANFNVKDYGAKSDGSADSTRAIQAAIDAASVSGGVVLVPAGTYKVTALSIASNGVVLQGEGAGSVLTCDSPTRQEIITIRGSSTLSGVEIRDLCVVGNYSDTTQIGIGIYGLNGGTFQNLTMRDVGFCGIFAFPASNVTVDSVNITHSGDFGVQFKEGSSNVTVSDSYLSGFASRLYPAHGIYFEGASNAVAFGNYISQVWDSPGQYEVSGIKYSGASGHAYNNTVEDSLAGISVPGGHDVLLDNNTIRRVTERGIYLLAGASNVTVQNNIIDAASRAVQFASYDTWPSGVHLVNNQALNCGVAVDLYGGSGSMIVEQTGNSWQGSTTTLPSTTSTTMRPTTTTTSASGTTTTTPAASVGTTTTTVRGTVPVYALTPVTLVQTTTTTTESPTTTTMVVVPTRTTIAPTTTTDAPSTTAEPAPRTDEATTTTMLLAAQTDIQAEPTSPPTGSGPVGFLSPAANSAVSGQVRIGIQIASTLEACKVRLYVDGRLLATDYRAPFTFSWNTRFAVPAAHTLTSVAYDQDGRAIGQATIPVTVLGNQQPASSLVIAAAQPTAGAFADITAGSPYGGAILGLAEAGAISGFDDGTFGAGRTTSRAQVAKMISGVLGIADWGTTVTPFTDLGPMDGELYPQVYISALYSAGAIEGTGPGRFSPYESVTRAQLVTMIVRALRTLDPSALSEPPAGFTPAVGSFSVSYDESMSMAEYNGLLDGLESYGPNWDPWAPATRGEVAQILQNLAALD